MSPDKQNDLYARYPDLFRDASLSPRESCMAWGITCEDGWSHILDDLCARLTLLKRFTGLGVVFSQVKEKLAGLRVYYRIDAFPTDSSHVEQRHWQAVVDSLISEAESRAARTCELTGEWGELHVRDGWLRTLNPKVAVREGFVKPKERT